MDMDATDSWDIDADEAASASSPKKKPIPRAVTGSATSRPIGGANPVRKPLLSKSNDAALLALAAGPSSGAKAHTMGAACVVAPGVPAAADRSPAPASATPDPSSTPAEDVSNLDPAPSPAPPNPWSDHDDPEPQSSAHARTDSSYLPPPPIEASPFGETDFSAPIRGTYVPAAETLFSPDVSEPVFASPGQTEAPAALPPPIVVPTVSSPPAASALVSPTFDPGTIAAAATTPRSASPATSIASASTTATGGAPLTKEEKAARLAQAREERKARMAAAKAQRG